MSDAAASRATCDPDTKPAPTLPVEGIRRLLPATLGVVLPQWKIVYVTTPEAACTSLLRMFASVQGESLDNERTALAPEVSRAATIHAFSGWQRTSDLQQLSDAELQQIARRDWLVCCVARHPVSRLWSAWQSKILTREPHYARYYADRPWFPRVPRRLADVAAGFREFVRALEHEDGLIDADTHWKPQVALLRADTFPYSHVGKLEELGTTVRLIEKHLRDGGWDGTLSLSHENATLLPLSAAQLGPATISAIERLYARDLEVFGYSSMTSGHGGSGSGGAGARVRSADLLVSAVRQVIERNERISDLRDLALARSPEPLGEPDRLPSLADTLTAVRRELNSALAAGQGQPVQFRTGPVELEFEIAVTCTGGGQTGVHLSVLTLGGPGAPARATTQRIKVTLLPPDQDSGAGQQPGVKALPERPVRAECIEVHEVADGLMLYQGQPECVHHLNNTAAIVFELCDGKNTVPEISEQLAAAFGLTGLPAGVAERCIADLRSKGVVL